MKMTENSYLGPYYEYLDFINECKNTTYEPNVILHSHHIIPTHLGGSNYSSNIVKLSISDHINAHIMLSKCFDAGSSENINNLRSARILNKYKITDKSILKSISDSYVGQGNPFFGKTHTSESKILMGLHNKERLSGKTYAEIYGDSAELQKIKRSDSAKIAWSNKTEEERRIIAASSSKSLIGKMKGIKNPSSIPVTVDGIEFECINDAIKHFGYTYNKKLYNKHTVTKIKSNKK
jgi:hypothetical protein